jgi:hypothetical protein
MGFFFCLFTLYINIQCTLYKFHNESLRNNKFYFGPAIILILHFHETVDKSQKNIFLPAEPLFLRETPQIQALSLAHILICSSNLISFLQFWDHST